MLLPPHIRIRPTSDDDRPILQRIYASTREAELAQIDWLPEEKHRFLAGQFDLQQRYYRAYFPNAEFYIIQHHTDDVGRLYVDRDRNELRVIELALLTEWRGKRIGSTVLRSLLADADDQCQYAMLHIEANNPVRSLCERFGFHVETRHGVYLKLGRLPFALAA